MKTSTVLEVKITHSAVAVVQVVQEKITVAPYTVYAQPR